MAPHLEKIKKRSIFELLRNKGSFVKGNAFNIRILNKINLNNNIAVGFTATKRLGSAVRRNRAKRLMRELSRKVLIKYGNINSYYVIIAKASIFETSIEELEIELKKLIS